MTYRLLSTLALCSTLAAGASAQSASPVGDVTPYRFSTSVNTVHLNVSVVNKKGKLVTDLEQADFHVYENGVPQSISYFSKDADSPVDVVLLVDASGSMDLTAKTANARNAAIQLIQSLSAEDRVAVYAFDKNLYRLSNFTTTKQDAIDSLGELEPFGSTALYDAISILSEQVIHEGFGRRAIVVLTDGVDTSSDATILDALRKAKGVDLPVYAIRVVSPVDDPESDLFLGVHGASFRGVDALELFTAETGGVMFEGSQWSQLAAASQRIREELKTQYRIGYVPQEIPGTGEGDFRRIQIQTRRKGIEVRTRKGYYPKKRSGLTEARPATSEELK